MKNNRYHINHTTRVAQLADQAHEESNVIYYEQLKTKKADQVIFYDIFNQKFAELILQECLEAVHNSTDVNQATTAIKNRFN
jgi:hypothetical protein